MIAVIIQRRARSFGRSTSKVGVVEPQRGCDGGGAFDLFIAWPTAIAASLKLDGSHRGMSLRVGLRFGSRVGFAVEMLPDVDPSD